MNKDYILLLNDKLPVVSLLSGNDHMKTVRPILSVFINCLCSKVFWMFCIFMLLIALLVSQNAQDMMERMFWLDEVTTLNRAIRPFLEIPKYAASGHMQPPIFYWLAHFASKIGTDPVTLRSVSLASYIIIVGFVLFYLRELQIATRVFLCIILILSPFSAYAATEFRPYALSALSILVSSVFLYRALSQPFKWFPALLYGLSALFLQYSLTLNCFAFGLQMFIIYSRIFISHEEGLRNAVKYNHPIIIISIFLCIEYAVFLNAIASNGPASDAFVLPDYLKSIWSNGEVLLSDIIFIKSWPRYVAMGFFLFGCIIGMRRNRWITAYLLLLLFGQLLFSTFMTFSRISWFSPRYLVASYVAFFMLCALGAEYLFQRIGKRTAFAFVAFLLATSLYGSIVTFIKSLNTQKFNPSVAAIEAIRCNNIPTIVLGDPRYISNVPRYAYRDDPLLIVPDSRTDLNEVISQAALKKSCFILQELKQFKTYKGSAYKALSTLSGYTGRKYLTKRGSHVPDAAWLFSPK